MGSTAPTAEQIEKYEARIATIKRLAKFIITKPLFNSSRNAISSANHDLPQTCCDQIDGHILCDACSQLLDKISEFIDSAAGTDGGYAFTIAFDYLLADLRMSAQLGCHLCSIMEANTKVELLHGKPSSHETDDEEGSKSWMSIDLHPRDASNLNYSWPGSLRLVHPNFETVNPIYLEFFPALSPSFVSLANARILPGSPCQNTGDQSTFTTIKKWLHTCQTEHDECHPLRPAEPNVPRRLLHLGATQVQVIENTESFRYACLSHCWGSQEHVPRQLLENGTRRPFDIATLPKTFRDAVIVTKTLGLEHLWIDCFCILQGSKEDWLRESAVMAQIYANSVFTVAALAASNVTEGCFRDRNNLASQTLHTDKLTVQSWNPSHSWHLEVNGYVNQSSPLHTRAWVVQERLSATRTIFFGSMGIYWECRSTRASESHTKSLPTIADQSEENTKLLLSELQAASELTIEDNEKWPVFGTLFFDRWTQLLRSYTQCSLTYASDRLIALSGITRDIEKYSGRHYVQGLWAEDLLSGLLWRQNRGANISLVTTDTNIPSKRSSTAMFPTWSWAKINSAVTHLTRSGPVIWQPRVHHSIQSPMHLRLITYKREVTVIDEDNIAFVDDGSPTGDLMEEYLWYSDHGAPEENVRAWAVLVQRTGPTGPYKGGAARCLIVTEADEEPPNVNAAPSSEQGVYRRLGVSVVKFDGPRDDPFPTAEPVEGRHEVVLI